MFQNPTNSQQVTSAPAMPPSATPENVPVASSGVASPSPDSGGSSIDPRLLELVQQMQLANASPTHRVTTPPVTAQAKAGSIAKNVGVTALSMFVPFLGGAVQKAVKAGREAQINSALNVFDSINNELEMAEYLSGGDENKKNEYLNSSPRLQAIFSDKKIAKQLSKVFGSDLLDPEKQNTVYHEAMKRHMQLKGEASKIKQLHGMMQDHAANMPAAPPAAPPQEAPAAAPQISDRIAAMPQKMLPPDPMKQTHIANMLKTTLESMGEGVPKTSIQMWYKSFKDSNKRNPSQEEIQAGVQSLRERPIDELIDKGITMILSGDEEGGKHLFDVAHMATVAGKGSNPPKFRNKIDLIGQALAGDKEAAAIYKQMRTDDMENAQSRGMGYGKGRAMFTFQRAMDGETGEMVMLPTIDMINAIKAGKSYIPIGPITGKDAVAVQQLVSEAGPSGTNSYYKGAIKQVTENLGAFDNASDRLIFAKAVRHMGVAERGKEHVWMGNVIDQALQANLSPEGKKLAISLRRLGETMGRLRTALGLPATDSSMALTMSLLPGPTTPDSKFARDQVSQLDAMVKNAVEIPMLHSVAAPAADGRGGAPKKSIDQILDEKFGKAAPKKP